MQNTVPAEAPIAGRVTLRAVPDHDPGCEPLDSAVHRTRSLLMGLAAYATEVAAVEDNAAAAMARLAQETNMADDRDRLLVLADRSRAHAENQRRLARRMWERIGPS